MGSHLEQLKLASEAPCVDRGSCPTSQGTRTVKWSGLWARRSLQSGRHSQSKQEVIGWTFGVEWYQLNGAVFLVVANLALPGFYWLAGECDRFTSVKHERLR